MQTRRANWNRRIAAWTALVAALVVSGAQAQGVSADTILIGQSAALSGPAQELGKEMKAGAEAYFKHVNESGGVNGRQIKLISLDDGYEPDRAAANTKKLIEEHRVMALFGYVGTPTSNAALPIFTEARVPFIGPFTGAQSLRDPFNRNIFHVRASYFDETEAIIDHLVRQGIKNIGVFYQNDAYGKAGLAGVERALKARKLEIASSATVERNTVDVAKAVETLSKSKTAAIVMISAYKSCAAFIKAMKKVEALQQYWNVSFVGSKALANELGDDGRGVQISQVVPFPWSETVPVVREYQARIGGPENYSFTSLEGYLAAKVLVEGLKRAGKNPTREALVDKLSAAGKLDLGGFTVSYTPKDHSGSKFVDLTIISKNKTFKR
ncbi:MAG TPA: ABC transporter substrate-binding protein [Usitatibacteraceae bacterium]|nr:ABC transporter substrate-binding protein [Usitatibacteraceae bacterium]